MVKNEEKGIQINDDSASESESILKSVCDIITRAPSIRRNVKRFLQLINFNGKYFYRVSKRIP